MIHAWGRDEEIDAFIDELKSSSPLLAEVYTVEVLPLPIRSEHDGFNIIASVQGETRTGISVDAATCPDCLHEITDPDNRRYGYPFTNCTHCGPRLSIIRAVPYDRRNTSMAPFRMCAACQFEYESQMDRHFHAQPNACFECGPALQLLGASGACVEAVDPIATAATWIREGKVIAIKGIGGIHLACDAANENAVGALRQRKRRYHKPFALMGRDALQIQTCAIISGQEQSLLESAAAPVVVLEARADCGIAGSVAPGQVTLGFMLPYTPLHHLLLQKLDGPIVLTSGNISDEPQCIDNDEARQRLHDVVDGYLLHNREIINRLDDSVVRVIGGKVCMMRRARGYAPGALPLPAGFEQVDGVLAMGGELKNTFCMIAHGEAIVSQHMGDLEHAAVHGDYRRNLKLYRQLYDFRPEVIAVDKHPDYFSSQWGKSIAVDEQCQLVEVQHHHAHVAACMAEHGLALDSKVLGVALDGLGMGEGNQLWGGEFLLASYTSCERVGSIQPVAMIGGAKAMYEPWRNSYAQLHAIGWQDIHREFSDLDVVKVLAGKPLHNLDAMIERGLNSPLASSTGRLFDAVAATLGVCVEAAAFEGQAAMALEVLAMESFRTEEVFAYPVDVVGAEEDIPILTWRPMWLSLLKDLQGGISRSRIAARFHHGLICAVSELAVKQARLHALQKVVLTGGVFQNRLLLEGVQQHILKAGMQVIIAADFPVNDGGLSLGQAVITAARALPETD